MKGKKAEQLLESIGDAFGFTKHDFEDGHLIFTKWGTPENHIDVENLGKYSLKISKDLGDIYVDKIKTDEWVIVGKGTTLHCEDIQAEKGVVKDFEGFLM
jgi:hypothetical protein